MTTIDTSSWKEFKLSDLFEKIDLKFKKDTFNKGNDISTVQTEEFSLPLCNAKDGNNGVMYYGRLSDFEYAEKVLDIVSDGAVSTGNVYVQIDKVGVLYNAYLIKPKIEIPDKALFFISTVLQKVLKEKYNYDNKAGWNKVKDEVISLPIKEVEEIDFEYMEQYIEGIENNINNTLRVLKTTQNGAKSLINTSEWKDFKLSEIFTKAERGNIKSLQTLSEGNTPIVAAGGYNQGIAGFYNVEPKYENCITISCNGAGCGSTFYHNYPFNLNGDAIVLIDNGLSEYVKMYLASVINKLLTSKYSYEEKCSADKALNESIKLPTNNQGKIDFQILEDSLKAVMKREREIVEISSNSLIYGWKLFNVKELFSLLSVGNKLNSLFELSDDGTIPVYSSETSNCGIVGYCNREPDVKINLDNPIYVIFGDHTRALNVATTDFCIKDNVKVLIPKYKDIDVLFYILSVWKKKIPNLGYSRHWSIAKDLDLLLPINENGELNIEYMKQYIVNLRHKQKEKIMVLQSI